MPCRVDEPYNSPAQKPSTPTGPAEAILCGVLTVIENAKQLKSVLDKVDWKEAGVTRNQAEKWWVEHKAEDQQRRLKEAALKKLTPAERKALGL